MDTQQPQNKRKLLTKREQPTGRSLTRMSLSSYQGRQEWALLVSKSDSLYVVNDAPQVACDNHCGTYVGGSPNGVQEWAYLHPDHLPRPRQTKVVDQSDPSLRWMSNENELIWDARGGRNTQRNVNLSPGAASETSHLSSRICHAAGVSANESRAGT
jgi:hypothetical protein